jgi:ribonucleoside-triphosphate reductase
MNVITININRLIQDGRDLATEVEKIHKYQTAFKELFIRYRDGGLLPTFSEGYIDIERQYLTIGINGVVEAAEYLGMEISDNDEYKSWVTNLLKTISDLNKINSVKYGCKFNTEFVPAENLGVKFASWDRADGYAVPRDCYNSYLYKVEDDEISVLDKMTLHGTETSQYLDGGSALHLNMETYASKETYKKLLNVAVKKGCEYFTFNTKITICNECENIDKRTLYTCPKCGSRDVDWATRVIGYLKKVSCFSEARQREHSLRHYHRASRV